MSPTIESIKKLGGSANTDEIYDAIDGAPTIDLMDGEKIAEKLNELKLGIETEWRKHISIDYRWFENF